MRCLHCDQPADGYAVLPGMGDLGEIRFVCDRDARLHKMRLRYWDGRDLGGWRENPDLGGSFYTLIFSFEDLLRVRDQDLCSLLPWVEDREWALAMMGAPAKLVQRLFQLLPPDRAPRIRALQDSQTMGTELPKSAQESIVDMIRKL